MTKHKPADLARRVSVTRGLLVGLFVTLAALAANAQTAVQLRTTGSDALTSGDYYRAVEAFSEALDSNPNDLASVTGLAEAFFLLGEYDQAEIHAVHARRLGTRNPDVLTLSGRIAIGLGDLQGAQDYFERAKSIERNNTDAEIGLAELALAEGRSLDAIDALERTLVINPEHRKALLSLVLVHEADGNEQTAQHYLDLALHAHGNVPETHLLAAEFALRRGDTESAASHARTAQALDPHSRNAALIRAAAGVVDGRNLEVLATAEELLRTGRSDVLAWYLRGQAQLGSASPEEAMDSFRVALRYQPDNEVVRLVAESTAIRHFPMDSELRTQLADYVAQVAADYANDYLYGRALGAYQRALRLTPLDNELRRAYAEIHRTLGHTATYLQELSVIATSGEPTNEILQLIDIYENLLSESVGARWGIDQFTLGKSQTAVALFLVRADAQMIHPLAGSAVMDAVERSLRSYERISVPVTGVIDDFPEAFALARAEDVDFFILLGVAETARVFELSATLHVARTGAEVLTFTSSRVGPDRVADAIHGFSNQVSGLFPLRAAIIRRNGNNVVLDAGSRDEITEGLVLTVLPPGALLGESGAAGATFDPESVLGTIEITDTDDLISEGIVTPAGIVDAVVTGDLAVIPGERVTERISAAAYPLLYDRVRALR